MFSISLNLGWSDLPGDYFFENVVIGGSICTPVDFAKLCFLHVFGYKFVGPFWL